MSKSRSRKYWKGRSWSRIFYLWLRNPGFSANDESGVFHTCAASFTIGYIMW